MRNQVTLREVAVPDELTLKILGPKQRIHSAGHQVIRNVLELIGEPVLG
jgi:hypothetical protein